MPYSITRPLRETVAAVVFWDALLRSYSPDSRRITESVTRLYMAAQKPSDNKWRTLHEGMKPEDTDYAATAYRCLSEELRLPPEIVPRLFSKPEDTGITNEEPFSTVLEHEIYRGKRLHYYSMRQRGVCRWRNTDGDKRRAYPEEGLELSKLAYIDESTLLKTLKPEEARIVSGIIRNLPPVRMLESAVFMPTDIAGIVPVVDKNTPNAIAIPIDNAFWIGM